VIKAALAIGIVLLTILTACSSTPSAADPESTPPKAAVDLVKQAKDDLAQFKGVPTSSVRFESAREVQFTDSSLGCPEPGMSYLQVITPGWSIVLSVGADKYSYGAANGSVVRCDHPPVVIEGGGPTPPGGGPSLH